MTRESEGVLVLDLDGNTCFASGIGRDSSVTASLRNLWRNRDRVPLKRLAALTDLERPLTVASIPSRDSVCFLIFVVQDAVVGNRYAIIFNASFGSYYGERH